MVASSPTVSSATISHAETCSIPQCEQPGSQQTLLGAEAVAQFGNIGNVVALVGTEHTLFISVGVPWLEQQIRSLLDEPQLTEEERYLIASLYTNLGCEDWVEVFNDMVRQAETPRVIAALMISAPSVGWHTEAQGRAIRAVASSTVSSGAEAAEVRGKH